MTTRADREYETRMRLRTAYEQNRAARIARLREQSRENFPDAEFLPGDEPPSTGTVLLREWASGRVVEVTMLREYKPPQPDTELAARAIVELDDAESRMRALVGDFDGLAASIRSMRSDIERRATEAAPLSCMWLVESPGSVLGSDKLTSTVLEWPSYLRRKVNP